MIAKRTPRTLLIGGALAAVLAAACGEDRGEGPNVVLIVVDTLRADSIMDSGGHAETPTADLLAADGVVFPYAFTHIPATLPAHTAMFSSRHPFETGILNNGESVREDLPLLSSKLEAAGWSTHAVLSLGTLRPVSGQGLARGFGTYDADFARWIDPAPGVMERLERALEDLVREQPFFLFAHFSDPHEPYCAHDTIGREVTIEMNGEQLDVVPTSELNNWTREVELQPGRNVFDVRGDSLFRLRWFRCHGSNIAVTWELTEQMEKTKHARIAMHLDSKRPARGTVDLWINDVPMPREAAQRYRLEVQYADRYVGNLIEALKRRGLYDDALIIYTSDHGEALGEHGHIGHVENLYDELLHVPLILKLPSADPRREALMARRQNLVCHVDLVPSLLELLGVSPLSGQRGRSLLSTDPEKNDRILIAETHKPAAQSNLFCLRDREFKMIYDPDESRFEMYDLAADPNELEDVFELRQSERSTWVAKLKSIADEWRSADRGETVPYDQETSDQLRALGY